MANIKYGPLAQEVAGTVGGVTFARSYTSKTCRGWRAPTNKKTNAQISIRTHQGTAVRWWYSQCTQAIRDAWGVYAATCPFTNSLGETYYLNGFNMFVRYNTILLNNGVSGSIVVPTATGFPIERTLTLTLNHTTGVLALTAVTPEAAITDMLYFRVHTLRPASRVFLVPKILFKDHFPPIPGSLPFTLYTYTHPLDGAGGHCTWVTCYWYDTNYRISPLKQTRVLST